MKNRIIFILSIIALCILCGCGEPKEKKIAHVEMKGSVEEPIILAKDADSIQVEVNFMNISGIDVRMLSIIDPVSEEQLNIAPLENEGVLTLNIMWPKEKSSFAWALYDDNGELCIDGTTDFSGIEKSATIVFKGEGNITDIDTQVN